jgi:hypothetical protein
MTQRFTKKNKRRMRRRGGGFSTGPAYVSAGNLIIHPNTQAGGPDCLASVRPGTLPHSSYGGLPGLSAMRGGRYGMSLTDSVLNSSRGIVGMPAQAVRIPCESGISNPMNLRGGKRRRRVSGGSTSAFPVINVGKAADMMAYHTPTAGYNNQMAGSSNVPLMIQVPYAAKSCMSGGTRRRGKKVHKKTHRRRN